MKNEAPDLHVQHFGNPVLRAVSAPVDSITPELIDLSQRMIQCMYDEEGIGLAAPQIGVNIRLFVIDTRNDDEAYSTPGEATMCPRMPLAIFNPQIVSTCGRDLPFVEGCLSVPKINATVIRPEIIRLRGLTADGKTFELDFGGLTARCMQHEIDHLDGILFTDRALEEDKVKIAHKLESLRQKTQKALRR